MKEIPGFEGKYAATEDGRIWSVVTGKFLSLNNKKNGYVYIELNVGGCVTTHRVHRLIALTYAPNPLGKPFVNHIDGDKRNNHASNLEWVTGTENNLHAVSIGVSGNPKLLYTVKFPNGEVQQLEGMDAVCAATGLSKNSVTNKVKSGKPGYSGHVITAVKRATTSPTGRTPKWGEMGGVSLRP